jgi:hypothetical protein
VLNRQGAKFAKKTFLNRQDAKKTALSQGVSTLAVMPAQAGIHVATPMDSGIRRNDETGL